MSGSAPVGAVASSDARASAAGAAVLRAGGNAVDAAVTAMLVLYVVEPQSCGPGGDGFMLHVAPGRPPDALDGSGEIPLGMSASALAADGLTVIPPRGARSVTVPGALPLLCAALDAYGTISFADAARVAIGLAKNGYRVGRTLAAAAERAAGELGHDPVLGPLYVPDGSPVGEGDQVRNPALAECLELVAGAGARALTTGALGQAIVNCVQQYGGYLSGEDLSRHHTMPVQPATTTFRDHDVWEFGPPTQGPAVLAALRQIEASGPEVRDWSTVIAAVAAGMAEAGFDLSQLRVGQQTPARGDTTYVAAVDATQHGASLISSVFGDFGSHLGVPELGGPLLNRVAILRPFHRDPEPGAKPPHTTIPAAVTRDGELAYVLGVAGGFMQPQAQVQVLIRLLESHLSPQAAIDAPRFKIVFGGEVSLEEGHPLVPELPHAAARPPGPEGYGAAHCAGLVAGQIVAGADPRRDGVVAFA